jgi:hypothetical protein
LIYLYFLSANAAALCMLKATKEDTDDREQLSETIVDAGYDIVAVA